MYTFFTIIETDEGILKNLGEVFDSYEEAKKAAESFDDVFDAVNKYTGWKLKSVKIVKVSFDDVIEELR